MYKINENYLKLQGSYLFSTIGKKVAAYKEANPDRDVGQGLSSDCSGDR